MTALLTALYQHPQIAAIPCALCACAVMAWPRRVK